MISVKSIQQSLLRIKVFFSLFLMPYFYVDSYYPFSYKKYSYEVTVRTGKIICVGPFD